MKLKLPADAEAIYASLDDIYFAGNPLIYFAEEFYRKGGEYLLLDEVHKYPQWSGELKNIINLVLESDLPTIFRIDYYSITKIKKMLTVLSQIVPDKPNLEKLARQTGTTRDTLLKYLYYLEKGEVINWLTKDINGINYLNKPDKIYLNNTNLMYAPCNQKPDKGNLRETFILNQLLVKHKVSPGNHNLISPLLSSFLILSLIAALLSSSRLQIGVNSGSFLR